MEGKEPNKAPSLVGAADPGLPRALWVQPSPTHVWPAAFHSGCNEIMCVCLQGKGVGMVLISLRSAPQNAAGYLLFDVRGTLYSLRMSLGPRG